MKQLLWSGLADYEHWLVDMTALIQAGVRPSTTTTPLATTLLGKLSSSGGADGAGGGVLLLDVTPAALM